MTTSTPTAPAVFVRTLITLAIGIAIGVPLGMWISPPPEEGPSQQVTRTSDANATGVEQPESETSSDVPEDDDPVAPAAAPAPEPEATGSELEQGLAEAAEGATGDKDETEPDDAPQEIEDAEPAETVQATAEMPGMDEVWPGRHLFITIRGTSLSAAERQFIGDIKPGGIVLTGQNIEDREQTIALVKSIKEAVGFGVQIDDLPLIAVDQEGGVVNRLNLNDAPSARELGDTMDTAFAKDVGKRYGAALSARGIGVLFAPVLDVRTDAAPASIAERTLGDDAAVVTPMGLAFADGAMEGGVIPVVKHYPGHGAAAQDSHETLAVLDVDIPALAEVMFPFSEAVARGVPGIMVGHIAVPAIDRDKPRLPATVSERMVEHVLRDSWGFEGVVIADDINMQGIMDHYSLEEAAVASLAAGNDAVIVLDPMPARIRDIVSAIELAVEDETLGLEQLAESRRRLDAWQAWLRRPRGLRGPLPKVPDEIRKARATPVPEETAESVGEPTTHRIERGETLVGIARKYGVTVEELMEWNDLDSPTIKFGFELKVYPDNEQPAQPEPEEMTIDPAAVDDGVEEPEPEAEPEPAPGPAPQPPGTTRIVHIVEPGEVLSRLAVQYGVRQSDIMAWSGSTDPIIRVGQKLIIYVPEEEAAAESPGAPQDGDEEDSETTLPAEEPAP